MGDEGRYEIPDDHNVLVATPNYMNVFSAESHSSHLECVSQWTKWGMKFKFVIVGRSFVQFARTQMCQVAVDSGFTHILWLDDDAIIQPYILPRFLSHGKDVVIAPYPMRKSPFEIGILSSTAFECNDCGNEIEFPRSTDAPILTNQVTCDKCGSKNVWRNFHKHHKYRNLTSLDLNQGLIDVDGGGTHAQLMDVKALTERRGGKPPQPGEAFNESHRSYPKELLEIHQMLNDNIKSDSDKKLFDHFIGDMPDQSLTFYEEDCSGKSYFLMPKTGTEDMYWCMPDGIVYGDYKDISSPQGEVLTHTGEVEESDQHHERMFSGNLVCVKPFFTEELRLTPNHGVLTSRGWVEAGKLLKTDKLFMPKPDLNNFTYRIDFVKYSSGAVIDETGIWFKRTTKKASHIPTSVEMNEDLAWLFGFYAAEGSSTKNTVTFSYNAEKEEKYANKVELICREKFNIKSFDRQRSGNSGNIRFSNKVLARFFGESFGREAKNKRLPTWICDNKKFSGSVLRGLWDGDGMWGSGYKLTTTSRTLAHQVKGLLASNNIVCGLCATKKNHPRVTSFSVYPLSAYRNMFGALCGVDIEKSKSDNFIEFVKNSDGGCGWIIPIRSIGKERYDGMVFNVGVPKSHSYVVNGISVHNCYRAKCKGIEIYADTDVFADHVSFAPVITKDFTIQAEDMMASGGDPNRVNLTPTSRGGRENGQIFKDKDSNLI